MKDWAKGRHHHVHMLCRYSWILMDSSRFLIQKFCAKARKIHPKYELFQND